MNDIYNTIVSNDLYLGIAVIISLVILISIIKKIVKLILILIAIVGFYFAYLYYNGEKIPSVNELKSKISNTTNDIKRKGNDLIEEAENEAKIKIKEGIKKEIRDEVDKLHSKD